MCWPGILRISSCASRGCLVLTDQVSSTESSSERGKMGKSMRSQTNFPRPPTRATLLQRCRAFSHPLPITAELCILPMPENAVGGTQLLIILRGSIPKNENTHRCFCPVDHLQPGRTRRTKMGADHA